ncbi:hypothetical protein KL930_000111 [Ogataea haglerorum]|uniref:Eukaryotic translation initiation factor 3 subunit D n=1 Tax=Ogataea haglerorum TaxID=1937702 RepID=A0ABQ7RE47_9ASCO|nr:uncharacterized protein KL911_001022 [Ogataea haglerorum]KAG7697834.1 hypothetical protein KL951_002408 [Ogataea haglerorum]KAG7701435.1 hypothetical protein KL915_000466 [Ogataea haglerorum]KAG7706654.1 hypothetical protein KL950_003319 [Ogataea haglerorum]KAG7709394.1 hypothetical protein KL914_001784 [Ogataea haglerorum]KAG7717743.1 hypothetical protein KL913_002679 [Ogataea haglerorum]
MTVPAFDFSKLSSPNDAWGPSSVIPDSLQFNGVPYAPFSKADRLGKAADWQQSKEDELKQQQLKNQNQKRKDHYHAYGASAAKLFGAEEEEEEFSVVDNSNAIPANQQTVLRGRNRVANQKLGGKPGNVARNQPSRPQQGHLNTNMNPNYRNFNNRYKKDDKVREPSLKVNTKWHSVSEIEFNKLTKLNLEVGEGTDLESYGSVHGYVKKFESFKQQALSVVDKVILNPTTSEDPVIQRLASEKKASVFVTDSILSQLMCAARSSYSWDIKVTKKDGIIYFDKRENTDRLEVDENSYNAPIDLPDSDVNSASNLSLEATFINNNFLANSLDSSVQEFEHPENPFVSKATSESLLNKGYKYRKFLLPSVSDNSRKLDIIVRTEIDAYSREQNKYLSINALNQYAPSPSNDWKNRLSGSRGVIFAEEIKKNNNKIARWTTKSLLAGIDSMKIGFVSRANPKDNTKHIVAGALTFHPSGLSAQINLSLGNGWAIVRSILDIIEADGGKSDYTFIILKDPNSPKITIYKVTE